jgi:hypothetical protein
MTAQKLRRSAIAALVVGIATGLAVSVVACGSSAQNKPGQLDGRADRAHVSFLVIFGVTEHFSIVRASPAAAA